MDFLPLLPVGDLLITYERVLANSVGLRPGVDAFDQLIHTKTWISRTDVAAIRDRHTVLPSLDSKKTFDPTSKQIPGGVALEWTQRQQRIPVTAQSISRDWNSMTLI